MLGGHLKGPWRCARARSIREGTRGWIKAACGTTQTISHMQQRRQLFEGTTAVELNAVDLLLMTPNRHFTDKKKCNMVHVRRQVGNAHPLGAIIAPTCSGSLDHQSVASHSSAWPWEYCCRLGCTRRVQRRPASNCSAVQLSPRCWITVARML